jgi:hypothetical protein
MFATRLLNLGLLAVLLVFCGRNGERGSDGSSCTTLQTPTGAVVTCGDGSTANISNGKNGAQGEAGEVGAQGEKGEKGDQGEQGVAGEDGLNGLNGTDGIDGAQGEPGLPGTPGDSLITPMVPCPTLSGSYPQVLLCINDRLYTVYVDKNPHDTRYAEVPPGTYETTDGRACAFRVVAGCSITY